MSQSFCWVLIMGALWETGAFATRTLSTHNQQITALVLVSQILVLIAPLCKFPSSKLPSFSTANRFRDQRL